MNDNSKQKIVIMGAGVDAERLYYSLGKYRNRVICLIDNYKKGKFHSLNIYSLEDIRELLSDSMILISSSKHYYDMKEQLVVSGRIKPALFGS